MVFDWDWQLLPDKFEYLHYQFAGKWMDIIGRIYMLITSGSDTVNDKFTIDNGGRIWYKKCIKKIMHLCKAAHLCTRSENQVASGL